MTFNYDIFITELLKLPSEDQSRSTSEWALEKKFKSADFPFLNSLKTPLDKSLATKAFVQLAELKSTYAETLQFFEIICDLILMGHHDTLFEKTDSLSLWQQHLKQLRYPQAFQRDQDLKTKFEALPWPYGSKYKFERRGDRAGVELKIFITSEADLIKLISSLERVKEKFNESTPV